MTEIGYQHGIVAGMNGLRDLDPNKTLLEKDPFTNKWPSIDTLQGIPLDQWKAWDKMERAFTILVNDHDAAESGGSPPDPPEPPPVEYIKVAPRVAYADGGSDARYCTINQPGVTAYGPIGHTIDESGATYDDNGLCKNGLRSNGSKDDCPTGARNIDGRAYCSLPTQGDPLKNTGSWLI